MVMWQTVFYSSYVIIIALGKQIVNETEISNSSYSTCCIEI